MNTATYFARAARCRRLAEDAATRTGPGYSDRYRLEAAAAEAAAEAAAAAVWAAAALAESALPGLRDMDARDNAIMAGVDAEKAAEAAAWAAENIKTVRDNHRRQVEAAE